MGALEPFHEDLEVALGHPISEEQAQSLEAKWKKSGKPPKWLAARPDLARNVFAALGIQLT